MSELTAEQYKVYAESCRKEVHGHADSIDYDFCVFVTGNSFTHEVKTWCGTGGPLTDSDPKMIATKAAELLRIGKESWEHYEAGAPLEVTTKGIKRLYWLKPEKKEKYEIFLFGFGIGIKHYKPVYFSVRILLFEFGLSWKYAVFPATEKYPRYWISRLLIGPLSIGFSRDA